MSKTERIRWQDIREIFHILGECRDLGDDYFAWRRHLGERMADMLGAQVVITGDIDLPTSPQFALDDLPPALNTLLDFGWDSAIARDTWQRWQSETMRNCDLFTRFLPDDPGAIATKTRWDAISDAEWYASEHFNEYVRTSQTDARLSSFSLTRHAQGVTSGCIALNRALGERRYTARDRNVLRLCHEELLPLLGQSLARANEPSRSQLPPRLREVLDSLLAGESEKQVAARLGLTPQSVHQYVKAVYRHFRVHSRAELMALWIRRRRSTPPSSAT